MLLIIDVVREYNTKLTFCLETISQKNLSGTFSNSSGLLNKGTRHTYIYIAVTLTRVHEIGLT